MNIAELESNYCINHCRAWCCKNIMVDYNSIIDQDTKLFFALRNIKADNETNKLIVPLKCNWLTKNNKCKLWKFRPISCKVYKCKALNSYIRGYINNEKKIKEKKENKI